MIRNKLLCAFIYFIYLYNFECFAQTGSAIVPKEKPEYQTTRATYSAAPEGYEQVGNTKLYYQQKGSSIDIVGEFESVYYGSTYANGGYKVAMSVEKKSDFEYVEPNNILINGDAEGEFGETPCAYGREDSCDPHPAYIENIDGNNVFVVHATAKVENHWENQFWICAPQKFHAGDRVKVSFRYKATEQAAVATEAHVAPTEFNTWDIFGEDINFSTEWQEFEKEILVTSSLEGEYGAGFQSIAFDLSDYEGANDYYFDDLSWQIIERQTTATAYYCNNGNDYENVHFNSFVEQQGELARINYELTNNNSVDVVVSLGTHADVMIGSNDYAPISRRIDQLENTYGLTMKDGNGAELCVLFGAGLAGVTKVDDFWFGHYSNNTSALEMIGNYDSGSYYYMVENGSYDSGMGWCWKYRTIPAGETVVFSYLIGVGEVNLEPNSSFEVTPDDPNGWNDLSRPHRLTLNGVYDSPAGIDGFIEFSVEDSETWEVLTETLSSGEEFVASLVATFNPELEVHTIRFRTVDAVGNMTLLTPIKYVDVRFHELSGIEDKTYNYGDSIYQTNLSCDLDENYYVINDYRYNVNAGTASFKIQGVFPKSIGYKTYSFVIKPLEIPGSIEISQDTLVYNGYYNYPEWNFTESSNNNLVQNEDYTLTFSNNLYPGEGSVEVNGIHNYSGSLKASFYIKKAPLTNYLYDVTLPASDIVYDGNSHGATIYTSENVGNVTLTYLNTEDNSETTTSPIEPGTYKIYLEIQESLCYYGLPNTYLGEFSIYNFDEDEWLAINHLNNELSQNGWDGGWDISSGMSAVGSFEGLTIEKGHVVSIDLSNQNLTGVFPSSILDFPSLKSINLSNNNLAGDISVVLDSVATTNPTLFDSIENLNLGNNQYSGNAGALAANFPNVKSLDLSGNCFTDIYPMISSTVENLNISNQKIDLLLELNLSEYSVDDIVEAIPSLFLYDHANQTFREDINLNLIWHPSSESEYPQWSLQIRFDDGVISFPNPYYNQVYHGESGDILEAAVPYGYGSATGSKFNIKLFFDKGDANFVGGVDVADLQSTILYAFDQYYYPFNFTAADTYKDDNINIQDIICTVNILIEQMSSSASETRAQDDNNELCDAYIYIKDNNVYLHTDIPVAAIGISANGNVDWCLDKYGLMQNVVSNKIIGYSLDGKTIPTGETIIGYCSSGTNIVYASLSDIEAQAISVKTYNSGQPTGINGIIETNNNTQIFDVVGRNIPKVNKGINIIIDGSKSRKMMIDSNK